MLLALMALAVVFRNDPTFGNIVLTVVIVAVVAIASVFLITLERIFKISNLHLFEAMRRFEFTESTIYLNLTGLGESRYGWQLITRIAKPAGWTFLMQSNLLAAAIPDSAFSSPEDLQYFRELVARKAELLSEKLQ